MCQLLGMSSLKPVSLAFSMQGFLRRGGDTGDHVDGWGHAHFVDGAWLLAHDVLPAARSPLALDVVAGAPRTRTAIVHVRKATRGGVSMRNCHPFVRTLWGADWAFAHNGNLEGLEPPPPDSPFQPVGDTDSEAAFCRLLDGLRRCFDGVRPDQDSLRAALSRLTAEIASHGTFNYLLSDGDVLFAHCSTDLYYLVRRAPFPHVKLVDCGLSFNLASVNHLDDRVLIVATQPLTSGERWQRLGPGQVRVFRRGAEQDLPSDHRAPAFAW